MNRGKMNQEAIFQVSLLPSNSNENQPLDEREIKSCLAYFSIFYVCSKIYVPTKVFPFPPPFYQLSHLRPPLMSLRLRLLPERPNNTLPCRRSRLANDKSPLPPPTSSPWPSSLSSSGSEDSAPPTGVV
ncbi:hypothetical protein PanWU01x14_154310 [Parasponia andersonii]|uniref:Uncharacterized protein n=1 Tax=Parasponia andersonii TaxID=3476 RepID=A0A2P5CGT2_PARAD|nr:hypothetical protein PanWU01x14_154310 [Parasponia andersonii]